MRYNPKRTGEIQFHCKNHKCKNSKENDGWFTPTSQQRHKRIISVEFGNGGAYLYCSEDCKIECPLYNMYSDPINRKKSPFTTNEIKIWKRLIFKEQFDKYKYNFCEYCECDNDLEVHHILPVKTNPIRSLDLDNGIILCKSCHLNIAHVDECSTSNLRNIICI